MANASSDASPHAPESDDIPTREPGAAWLSDEDVLALLDGLGVAGTHDPEEDQEAIAAAEWEARQAYDDVGAVSPVLVGEHVPAGPGLAAILAQDPPADASDWDLPGLAASYRRLAGWAQASELAACAEIAVRRAAANPKIGTTGDGRPQSLPPEAAAEVALELAMTQPGASAWTALACQLRWALPDTGAALGAGRIDLPRARIIAEATTPLSGEHAAQVEARVLPAAGGQTTGQLRAAVRRAVLAVDPDGAEQRRRDTERVAKVALYPGEEGTATLAGSCLPAVQAAAAMARITAMARALKAAGAHGGLDLLRAHIFLGLLLDTLPLIPPPAGAPPDNPPPSDNPPPDDNDPPADDGPAGPLDGDGTPADTAPSGDSPAPDSGSPAPHGSPGPDGGRSAPDDGGSSAPDDGRSPGDASEDRGPSGPAPDSSPAPDTTADRQPDLDAEQNPDDMDDLPGWWPDIPSPGDADAPPDDGDPPDPDAALTSQPDDTDDDWPQLPPPDWPPLRPQLPAPPGLSAAGDGARLARTGLLDVLIPWTALAGYTCEPAILGRIGPISSRQAQQLVMLAAHGPATQWRVVVTGDDGRALAVQRASPPWRAPAHDTDPEVTGLIGRVTITIRASHLTTPGTAATTCHPVIRDIAATALDAAARAAARAEDHAWQDAAAAGGCAHAMASEAYRPPPRIREHVASRDCTCRFGPCGQPAWRTDIDHTLPWHKGGPTCPCNLGGCCRTHHKIKQLPGWQLDQPQPGTFRWTTPAGRSYLVQPDQYPV